MKRAALITGTILAILLLKGGVSSFAQVADALEEMRLFNYSGAIPYLEKAVRAKRYESRSFPHFNLSRVYLKKGMLQRARLELRSALSIDPDYRPARQSLSEIDVQLN